MESPQPAEGAAPVQEAPPKDACPRCGAKLVNPDTLGWCTKCGYCRATESPQSAEGAAAAAPAAPPSSALGVVEFVKLVQTMPAWVRVLLGGAVLVVAVSFAGHLMLPKEGLGRALWSTIELGVGLLVILAGQFWALTLLAPSDDKLGPKDAFIPFRLWKMAFKKLPATCKPVWAGTWGVSGVACATLLVGGLDYWFQFYKPKQVASKNMLAAASKLGQGKEKELTEAVKDFADTQDLTKQDKDKKDKEKIDKRPAAACLILGYVPGQESGTIESLVVAALRGEEYSYAGLIKKGLTPEKTKEILGEAGRVKKIPDPLIAGARVAGAVWLEAKVFCEVHNSGFDREGKMLDPNFKDLLKAN